MSGSFLKFWCICLQNKIVVLRLAKIRVTIPETASNGIFFSLYSFLSNIFLNLRLLWAVGNSLQWSSHGWNYDIKLLTQLAICPFGKLPFSKFWYICLRNKILLLRLARIIATIPGWASNGNFISLYSFLSNIFFKFTVTMGHG